MTSGMLNEFAFAQKWFVLAFIFLVLVILLRFHIELVRLFRKSLSILYRSRRFLVCRICGRRHRLVVQIRMILLLLACLLCVHETENFLVIFRGYLHFLHGNSVPTLLVSISFVIEFLAWSSQ